MVTSDIGQARAELVDEYAAAARVATLVATGADRADVFAAVSREVEQLFRFESEPTSLAAIIRFDPAGAHVAVGLSQESDAVSVGSIWADDELFAPTLVIRTGRSARIDEADLDAVGGPSAQMIREVLGYLCQVASPIVVNGRLWGALSINAGHRLPDDTAPRLEKFTELAAMAIGNVESRQALTELAREQTALRRVATLLAGGDAFQRVFSTVCDEVGVLLDADATALVARIDGAMSVVVGWSSLEPLPKAGSPWPLTPGSVAARVMETARPVRIDDGVELDGWVGEVARRMGLRSTVGAPITVGGKLWGVLLVSSRRAAAWAERTENRLTSFTDLIAMAISNADAVRQREDVAAEQAALRQVATLVARGASSREVADAVAAEVGKLLGADLTILARHDSDDRDAGADTLVAIAAWSDTPEWVTPVGTRRPAGGDNAMSIVLETGKPARMDDQVDSSGEFSEVARSDGYRASIAAPITVDGRVWGVMLVANRESGRCPPGAETRLAAFTGLVATALANAQAQDELRRHVQGQAALQRVAILVAESTAPAAIFSAVSREVETLFGGGAAVVKFEHDPPALSVVGTGDHIRSLAVGVRYELTDEYASTAVYRTGRSARREAGLGEALGGPLDRAFLDGASGGHLRVTSMVSSPLTVAGQLWGAITISGAESLPPDTEARLERFADIVAIAIANADSRQALATLAAEQAALRRIATQVAQGLEPQQIFAAVTDEIAAVIGEHIGAVVLVRFEEAGPSIVLEGSSAGLDARVGTRWKLSDALGAAGVYRTGKSFRVDNMDWTTYTGPVADLARRRGSTCQVSTPIIVEGKLWGTITVGGESRLPDDTEQRTARFTELVAAAIANAQGKYELAASRRRIVNAGDEARRRIERNLHDGIQQGLIELAFRAQSLARKEPDQIRPAAAELAERLDAVSEELREVSRGIHPTILSEAGLGPALRALARRSSVPAAVDVRIDRRLPDEIEAAAYYVASEALVNVTKHAQATLVELQATLDSGSLLLRVRDDGAGGVDPSRGSGILGINDRVEALGGSVTMNSPIGEGTELCVVLPSVTDSVALFRFEEGDHG
jgi:signal transduction histidine kinase